MKKLLSILAISALAVSVHAQGTVVFGNQTGLVKQWTSTTVTTLISAPKGTVSVELIAAPKGTPLLNPLFTAGAAGVTANYSSLAGFLAANTLWKVPAGTANPGLMNGANGVFLNGNVTIANILEAAAADYFVIGWSGAASGLDAALASTSGLLFGGQSAIFSTGTGNPLATPAGVPTNLKTSFGGMTLSPIVAVPEPTSFALAGLGLAALLVLRRRNS